MKQILRARLDCLIGEASPYHDKTFILNGHPEHFDGGRLWWVDVVMPYGIAQRVPMVDSEVFAALPRRCAR